MEQRAVPASLLTRLDPRTSLLTAAAAALVFSMVQSLTAALLSLGFAFVLAAAGKLPVPTLLRQLAAVNIFILFLWLTVPTTMPGESVFSLGPLIWSREGIDLALLTSVKCNAILLSFLALVSGLDLPLVGCALERLRVPSKLVFLFLFCCRHIHGIGGEWRRLQTAAALRGFVPRNSLHTYRTIGAMLGLTFVNALDRSRRVYEAMLLRGFDGGFRTVTKMETTSRDKYFRLFFAAALAGIIVLDVYFPRAGRL